MGVDWAACRRPGAEPMEPARRRTAVLRTQSSCVWTRPWAVVTWTPREWSPPRPGHKPRRLHPRDTRSASSTWASAAWNPGSRDDPRPQGRGAILALLERQRSFQIVKNSQYAEKCRLIIFTYVVIKIQLTMFRRKSDA